LGIDRLAMVVAGEMSAKEMVAFPTNGSGKIAIMNAPAAVTSKQLRELKLKIIK
jgi:aspartyl-tRNA synthetase